MSAQIAATDIGLPLIEPELSIRSVTIVSLNSVSFGSQRDCQIYIILTWVVGALFSDFYYVIFFWGNSDRSPMGSFSEVSSGCENLFSNLATHSVRSIVLELIKLLRLLAPLCLDRAVPTAMLTSRLLLVVRSFKFRTLTSCSIIA